MISLDVFNSIKAGAETNTRIFTPQKIVREMLDALPPEVWNSKTTFLDPAVKSGVYLVEIFNKLMESSEVIKDFPDEQTRKDHILKNQLFGIAIDEFDLLIAQRNLYGFIGGDSNIRTIEKYMDLVKNKDPRFYVDVVKKEFGNMKFDIVIGNPPYQEVTGGGRCGGKPLYTEFVKKAKEISERYSMMIIPAKWYITNKDTKLFSEWMFKQSNIKKLWDYNNIADVFDGVTMNSGVCFYLMENGYIGKCEISNCTMVDGKTLVLNNAYRDLCTFASISNKADTETFIRDNIAFDIIQKIYNPSNINLDAYCSNVSPFGLKTTVDDNYVRTSPSEVEIIKSYNETGYIERNNIKKVLI